MTTPQIMRWVHSNKLLVFFGVVTFCFLVSTVALSAQNNALKRAMMLIQQRSLPNQAVLAESNRYRLPKHVKPLNYALKLNPNLSKKVFEGEVKILLNISKPVRAVSLHVKDLDIHCVEVKSTNNQSIPVVSTKIFSTSEVLQVNLKEEIQACTNYEIFLTFTGRLEGIVGFYASTMRNGKCGVHDKCFHWKTVSKNGDVYWTAFCYKQYLSNQPP